MVNLNTLILKIAEKIQKDPFDRQAYEDYYATGKELLKQDDPQAVGYLKWLAEQLNTAVPALVEKDLNQAKDLMAIHRRTLQTLAPVDFDSYLLFVEWNREPKKKFYVPRRAILKQVVDALQDLADDKLDILAISMPPGVGKTTLALFYLTWLAGKYPDDPILTGSHSNSFIRGTYDECLRIFEQNGEYLWGEAFPGVAVCNTNAKDCRIDIGSRKRFETLQFTSIGTGNAGLYRAARLLYCDDLVSGIEVALSKDRLDKLWETYTTDLRQRKIGDKCKELHIATRWSVHDVIGRLEEEYEGDPRARFIALSAMNEQDESNFHYPYGVGFSTKFYREQREIMDKVNWEALYMNHPIERMGLLYLEDELQRYFELPDEKPDAVISVCDTKDKGSDDCVMPIAYKYGDKYYIEEIVCDNGNYEVVDGLLVSALMRHKVKKSCFESNSAGGRVAQKVQEAVKAQGGITKIETKYTTQNKETKIIVNAPWVKEHCLFRDDTVSSRDYKRAVGKLCSYTTAGKNKHDDVPDAFAQLAEYAEGMTGASVQIIKRPW